MPKWLPINSVDKKELANLNPLTLENVFSFVFGNPPECEIFQENLVLQNDFLKNIMEPMIKLVRTTQAYCEGGRRDFFGNLSEEMTMFAEAIKNELGLSSVVRGRGDIIETMKGLEKGNDYLGKNATTGSLGNFSYNFRRSGVFQEISTTK
jgi:hypothetical protein